MHEASLHDENCFVTLTYDDDNLPKDGSLRKKDFQNFVKRLRKAKFDKKIRYYHCGEYGENTSRPHYHCCFFGIDFDRKMLYCKGNSRIGTSSELALLWPFGFNVVGDVTFDSAAYCARYILKKSLGKESDMHYLTVNIKTGEILKEKQKEYTTMSRRPGIGRGWYEKYKNDVYPSDEVIVKGISVKPPKYYDSMLEIENPEILALLKAERRRLSDKIKDNNCCERLVVREKVAEAGLKIFKKRSFENG